jgi:hypothetical protein
MTRTLKEFRPRRLLIAWMCAGGTLQETSFGTEGVRSDLILCHSLTIVREWHFGKMPLLRRIVRRNLAKVCFLKSPV